MPTVEIRPQAGPQWQAAASKAQIVITGGAAGGGKLLSLDTPIPTPDGWVDMGNIRDGDKIFGQNGEIIEVIKAWDITTEDREYELVFDDGSRVKAGKSHL
jgi:replicative DNA helicase